MWRKEPYSLATPALALCSSERAYFITCERSECPISSADSLTCPGLACKNQVPNVRLRPWGFYLPSLVRSCAPIRRDGASGCSR
jgi:hypothetical protein